MTVISSERDPQTLTLSITAELAAEPARVWQLWQQPHYLERWWGPPGWPATFMLHEFSPGGSSHYYMTGPDGRRAAGWMRFLRLEEPQLLEFDDGFADETGAPDLAMPVTHERVEIQAVGPVTRMTVVSSWQTSEDMQRLVDMGMEEGMGAALGQMDALLVQAQPRGLGTETYKRHS